MDKDIESIITATATVWGRDAAEEARRQGWTGDSSAGDVDAGVCGHHYLGLDGDLSQALGRSPTAQEIEIASEVAYTAACERLDELDEAEAQAEAILDAADEQGIIQATDMVDLMADPKMHCTSRMWDVAAYCGEDVHAAMADLVGYDPAD